MCRGEQCSPAWPYAAAKRYGNIENAPPVCQKTIFPAVETVGANSVRPYGPPQSLPCVKGDSPQCGEMSRSDRGARRVSGWHGVSRGGGIGACMGVLGCTRKVAIPQSALPRSQPPLHKGAFCVRVGVDSISTRAIWQQRKTLRASNVRPYILYRAKSMLFDTLKRRSNTALFRAFL